MIHFSHPIVLLLAVPALFFLRRGWQAAGVESLLRVALVAVLIVVAAGPSVSTAGRGTTVVMVFDRSRSMPSTADRFAKDLMKRAEAELGLNDQLAAVGFGAAPLVEQFPAVGHPPETGLKRIDPEQSNLHAAIGAALDLIPDDSRGRLIVVSDGLAGDSMTDSLAERLRRRRVPVSFQQMKRRVDGDVVLESVTCPIDSDGAEIVFDLEITASEAGQGTVRIRRDAADLPSFPVEIDAGSTHAEWRDRAPSPGVVRYSFSLDAPGDPTLENNQWDVWLRVRGVPTVLVVNAGGGESPVVQLVRRAGAAVQTISAKQANISVERLSGFAACVLDDVPADDLAPATVQALAHYVEHLGGGLIVTGGAKGLGAGGYRFGSVEPLLPVNLRSLSSTERAPVALVVLVDPNAWEGSGYDVDEHLSPLQKSIIALAQELDSADRIGIVATRTPPVLLALSSNASLKAVRDGVEPLGFPGDPNQLPKALDAAWELLSKATQPEKHLVVCIGTDQAASWQALNDPTRAARSGGATLTIMTWGTPPEWLNQTAMFKGSGKTRQVAASDASELAKLFRRDWETRTGGGFVNRATPMLSVLESGLVDPAASAPALPAASGFHPAMLRTGSRATLVARDNPNLPLAAEGDRGLGRSSVFLFPVERGTSSDDQWEQLARVLVAQLQWTARLDGGARAIPVRVEQRGRRVTISLDAANAEIARLPGSGALELDAASPEKDSARVTEQFRRSGADLVADIELDRASGCVPVVRKGESFLFRCPPVILPRSAEFMNPAGVDHGRKSLETLAELSGGGEWSDSMPIFGESGPAYRSLTPFFAWLALTLLLVDIADRRHHVIDRFLASGLPTMRRAPKPAVARGGPAPTEDVFEQAKERTRRRLKR